MKTWLKWLTVPALSLAMTLPALAREDDDLSELQNKLGNEWVLVKNDRLHSVKTYVKQEDAKRYRSFKVEAVFEGSMDALMRVIMDFDHYGRWSWNVLESKLLKKVSPTEYIMYVVHDSPYGVPDRDIVLKMTIEPQTPSRPYITFRFNAMPDYIPEKPPYVRMQAEDMVARFTPMGDGKFLVTNEGYVDPGGKMAPWAINFVSRNAPYITLLGMRRMMSNDEYVNAKTPLPFAVSSKP